MRSVCFHLDEKDYEYIQQLVKKGYFANMSEFLRLATKLFLYEFIHKEYMYRKIMTETGVR